MALTRCQCLQFSNKIRHLNAKNFTLLIHSIINWIWRCLVAANNYNRHVTWDVAYVKFTSYTENQAIPGLVMGVIEFLEPYLVPFTLLSSLWRNADDNEILARMGTGRPVMIKVSLCKREPSPVETAHNNACRSSSNLNIERNLVSAIHQTRNKGSIKITSENNIWRLLPCKCFPWNWEISIN